MINLTDIAYVRLGTTDLDGSAAFLTNVIGLELSHSSSSARYFRSNEKCHTLCLFKGDASSQTVAFAIKTTDELDSAAATLEDQKIRVYKGTTEECLDRHVTAFIGFADPSGNHIELVVRQQQTSRPFVPQRNVDIRGFNHVGLYSTNPLRDEKFWTHICNAKVSDRIGDVALMRVNAIHHNIALAPSKHAGIHHINHQVGSTDDVLRSFYFLKKHNVPIVFGPGRHPTSGARFLYFRGPDNVVYEYSVGVDMIEDEASYSPRQFAAEPWSLCMWGAVWQDSARD